MTLDETKYTEILEFVLNGKPYREIADSVGVSKNTVTNLIKRLRETGSIFPSTTKQSIYDPVIKEIQEHIIYFLRLRRSTYNLRHKIKLSNKEIYLLLLAKGYNISFTKVKELIKLGKNVIKESYLNIVHLPGEAVEFDWGTIRVQIGDNPKATKVSLAVFSFPYSNYKMAYVLPNGNSESFVIAFKQFINDMNGVPPKLVLDNMRIARIFSSAKDSDVKLTTLFEDLSSHYKFNVSFCSPHCPNQKGNVENNVGILKKQFEQSYINSFDSMEELQEYVDNITRELNIRKHPRKNDKCENLINHERNRLIALPKHEYIYYHRKVGKVSNNCMLRFKNNQYSIPEMFKGEKVLIKYNDKTIYIITKDGKDVIAKYANNKQKGKRKHRVWYIINKLKGKSNGLLDSEEYKAMSKPEKLLLTKVFKSNSDDFLAFLEKIKHKPRNLIRKFVYKNKYTLEYFSSEQLMHEILKI
ncbi:hypothetical protein GCM10011351_17540 [Paraliobacillus quinghaiensis]|uniref:Integrase catalytic domain-containing protein n=1 Tax=Paraliobacillus quinghaiensis TaxID=470815 RepID=A0A917WVG1_9BACI|nr:IS21 family transposase [Paraliobacillus quinghaiensis]GGM31817.1 hypothetical protein GCM10011351_17540 [Paraliobacillus quinghaiensis]